MLKVDLHAHSDYIQPWETSHSPKEMIDEAVRQGYDVFCFSEHYIPHSYISGYKKDPLKTYRDFRAYAAKKGLLLLPAVEIRFKEGDVVLANFKGNIKDFKKLEDLKKVPKDTLVIAAHPFFRRPGICLGNALIKNIGLFDAIEYSFYYIKHLNMNKKGVRVAQMFNKPMVGNSDCHDLTHFGYTYNLVNAKKDPKSIVKAIKDGQVTPVTKPLPFLLFFKIAFFSGIKVAMLQLIPKRFREAFLLRNS